MSAQPKTATTENQWLAAKVPLSLWNSRRVRSHRKRRLALCACVRRVLPVLNNDPRAVGLIEACERYADSSQKAAPAAWKAVLAARRAVWTCFDEIATETRHVSRRRSDAMGTFVWVSEATLSDMALTFARAQSALRGKPVTPRVPEAVAQTTILRDVFGNPFRPVIFSPEWRTDTAVTLACQMYEAREFAAMPILADALQDAGCDSDDILNHCRGPGPHVRGCWVVDLVLSKE